MASQFYKSIEIIFRGTFCCSFDVICKSCAELHQCMYRSILLPKARYGFTADHTYKLLYHRGNSHELADAYRRS